MVLSQKLVLLVIFFYFASFTSYGDLNNRQQQQQQYGHNQEKEQEKQQGHQQQQESQEALQNHENLDEGIEDIPEWKNFEKFIDLRFKTEFNNVPLKLTNKPSENHLRIKDVYDNTYDCLIPSSNYDLNESEEKKQMEEDKPVTFTEIRKALAPLKENPCLYKTSGFWTYKFCHESKVQQFHIEEDGRVKKENTYTLGEFVEPAESEKFLDISGLYTGQYTGGDACWNGVARSTTVKVFCEETHQENYIHSIKETSLCQYTMNVYTSLACLPLKSEITKPMHYESINCQLMVEEDELTKYLMKQIELPKRSTGNFPYLDTFSIPGITSKSAEVENEFSEEKVNKKNQGYEDVVMEVNSEIDPEIVREQVIHQVKAALGVEELDEETMKKVEKGVKLASKIAKFDKSELKEYLEENKNKKGKGVDDVKEVLFNMDDVEGLDKEKVKELLKTAGDGAKVVVMDLQEEIGNYMEEYQITEDDDEATVAEKTKKLQEKAMNSLKNIKKLMSQNRKDKKENQAYDVKVEVETVVQEKKKKTKSAG